jgi:hypothetical protein
VRLANPAICNWLKATFAVFCAVTALPRWLWHGEKEHQLAPNTTIEGLSKVCKHGSTTSGIPRIDRRCSSIEYIRETSNYPQHQLINPTSSSLSSRKPDPTDPTLSSTLDIQNGCSRHSCQLSLLCSTRSRSTIGR